MPNFPKAVAIAYTGESFETFSSDSFGFDKDAPATEARPGQVTIYELVSIQFGRFARIEGEEA